MTLTHSRGWIATAVSRTGRVGIDVQGVHDVAPSLARRCLSPGELDWLDRADGAAARDHRFCRLWTAKEAYLKAVGVGLAADPRDVGVDLCGDRPRLSGPASEQWQLAQLDLGSGVCLTVCTERAA
jgi:4'-phosphopantetheinyl transferase